MARGFRFISKIQSGFVMDGSYYRDIVLDIYHVLSLGHLLAHVNFLYSETWKDVMIT